MSHRILAWLPMLILPASAFAFTPSTWPRWGFMWLLAFAIFAGVKWLTWWTAPSGASWGRQMGYLFAWPGLDAHAFLFTLSQRTPPVRAWFFALAKLAFGLTLLLIGVPAVPADQEILRGWVGMTGIVFVLHFGIFHLLSVGWQTLGVNAKPVMNWPMLATSVSQFWGERWNTAFRDLTHRFLFRPLTTSVGARAGLAIGFLFSGLLHEVVITLPAGGGYGGPTCFFLLQGAAIFLERSAAGKRLGLGHGLRGWAFTMFLLLGPVALLFPPAFQREIVVPFVDWFQ